MPPFPSPYKVDIKKILAPVGDFSRCTVPAVNHLSFPFPSLPFLFLARAKAPAQTKIYVGNVEPHITAEIIKTVFEPFGMVDGAEMVVDPNNPGLSSVELRRAQGDETAVDVVFSPAPTMLGWVRDVVLSSVIFVSS